MRRTIYETNALGTVTAYGYCQCGALESVTSALGKPEQLVTQHVVGGGAKLVKNGRFEIPAAAVRKSVCIVVIAG